MRSRCWRCGRPVPCSANFGGKASILHLILIHSCPYQNSWNGKLLKLHLPQIWAQKKEWTRPDCRGGTVRALWDCHPSLTITFHCIPAGTLVGPVALKTDRISMQTNHYQQVRQDLWPWYFFVFLHQLP